MMKLRNNNTSDMPADQKRVHVTPGDKPSQKAGKDRFGMSL